MSVDCPNPLSSALGELVNKLSDAYFSDKEKEIKISVRFVIATSGTVCYTMLLFGFKFNQWSTNWDPAVSVTIFENLSIVLISIGGFSIYLGFLISLTKFQYSYIRLFLAGVFLPAIVFTLIPA